MWIPGRNDLSTFHLIGIAHGQLCTVGNTMSLSINTMLVMNHQFTRTRYDNIAAIITLYRAHADPGYGALILYFNTTRRCDPGCCAPNVEGAHRQLSPWLADTLCRHHANRFATANQVSPG